MPDRRILRLDRTGMSIARSARFDSEQTLNDAIAGHPEVLPHEDMGLGPLVSLATEIPFSSGYPDLLAPSPRAYTWRPWRPCSNPSLRARNGPVSNIAILAPLATFPQRPLPIPLLSLLYYASYGGGPGITYLLERFIPRLRAEGLGDIVDQIMIDNPARAFAFAGRTG